MYSTLHYCTVLYSNVLYSAKRTKPRNPENLKPGVRSEECPPVGPSVSEILSRPINHHHCSQGPCHSVMNYKYLLQARNNHNTVVYCTVLYCTALYCTVLYCTVLHVANNNLFINLIQLFPRSDWPRSGRS